MINRYICPTCLRISVRYGNLNFCICDHCLYYEEAKILNHNREISKGELNEFSISNTYNR